MLDKDLSLFQFGIKVAIVEDRINKLLELKRELFQHVPKVITDGLLKEDSAFDEAISLLNSDQVENVICFQYSSDSTMKDIIDFVNSDRTIYLAEIEDNMIIIKNKENTIAQPIMLFEHVVFFDEEKFVILSNSMFSEIL
jgi:hypothetical protein